MKKLILFLAIAGIFTYANAQKTQKLTTKDVPTAVAIAFSNAYPTIKDVEWSKNGNNFVAEYDLGKTDRFVTYDVTGILIDTRMKIASSALPISVMQYVKKNYDEDEVKKSCEITDATGIVTYKTRVKGTDLYFDSKGNFIKSVKD
jgi:hypothetical protein